jgi:hypothetical protein
MRLGEGRFSVAVEAMAGEEVVWEGGPSPKATCLRALRWLIATIGLWAFFVPFFTAFFLSVGDAPARRAAVQAEPAPEPTPAELQARREMVESRRREFALRYLATTATAFAAFGGVFLFLSRRKSRNAWYVVTTERVCIQSGGGQRVLLVVDLDKILSVQATSFWLDRRCGLHHVELAIGGMPPQKVPAWAKTELNALAYVPVSENLLSKLTNDWLPRDNRG